MGAEVLGCGHASQLFEVNYMDGAPQVHLHFLTDDNEYKRQGFGRLELVCHGCGASRLVLYDNWSGSRRRHIQLRNMFRDLHKKCPDMKGKEYCPDYRSTSEILDVRGRGKVVDIRTRAR